VAKVSPLQSNFNGGEFSPLLYGRVDTERYTTGLALCQNYIPTIQGGLTRRPGTYFVAEVGDSASAARLIPFEFSVEQAYMLEFGPQTIRIFKDYVPVTGAPQLISNGDFDTDITDWDEISGSIAWSSGAMRISNTVFPIAAGIAEQDIAIADVGVAHTLSFQIMDRDTQVRFGTASETGDVLNGVYSPGMHTVSVTPTAATMYLSFTRSATLVSPVRVYSVSLLSTNASIVEVVTPYSESDLAQLRYVQSADVLYLVHPDYAPRTLSRTSHVDWTLDTIDFLDGPYLSINTTATTISSSGTSGTVTLTASAATFASTDVGRPIRILHLIQDWAASTAYAVGDVVQNDSGRVYRCTTAGTSAGSGGPTGTSAAITDNTVVWEYVSTSVFQWGWATIATYTSATVVSATVGTNFGNTIATSDWRLGLWSDTTGYPTNVLFHEDRLMFSGSAAAPQRIDGSESGDYTSFSPTEEDGTVTDANAVSFTLNSNTANAIRWMRADERGLMVGTSGGEWVVRPSSLGEALSPTNISAKKSTSYGSNDMQAISAGKAALYVQRSGRKLRELRYSIQDDGFDSPDLTLLAEHITGSGLREIAHQKEPQSLVWAVRTDGALVAMTYERDTDSLRVGWHRHVLGGAGDAAGDPPTVESVAVIPSPDGSREDVWLLVRRWVNGAYVRYVEYITQLFDDLMDLEDAYFVDCGLSYSGPATDSFAGLDHLEGETLAVLADGAAHPDVTVSSGAVTLDYEASRVHIGYVYDSKGQMLRLEAGARDGTALGKTRRVHQMAMLLHRTLGMEIGMDFDHLDEITFRTSADIDDAPPELFSGILRANVDGNYDTENQFCWLQRQPLPGTLLALMPQLVTQDRG
jgi:hypothetical protein